MNKKSATKSLSKSLAIGELLKQRRQELKITILEVSAKLKVKPHDIEEIENNSGKSMKSKLYLTGFIRSYGKLLKIDQLEIEEKIKSLKIKSNTSNKKHRLLNVGQDQLMPDKKTVNNATMIFISLFVILLFAYNFHQHFNNFVPKLFEGTRN
jgi:cytoskeletal protein RodZ